MPITRVKPEKPPVEKTEVRVRLDELAAARGITLTKLADMAGVMHNHFHGGSGNFQIKTLKKIAEAHGCSLDWLVLGRGSMGVFTDHVVLASELPAVGAALGYGYSAAEVRELVESADRPPIGAHVAVWMARLEERRNQHSASHGRLLLPERSSDVDGVDDPDPTDE